MKDRLASIFKERQLYLRSDGEIRLINISSGAQITAVLFLTLFFVWGVYSTIEAAFKDQIIASIKEKGTMKSKIYENKIARIKEEANKLTSMLEDNEQEYHEKVKSLAKVQQILEMRQRIVDSLLVDGLGQELAPMNINDQSLDNRSPTGIKLKPSLRTKDSPNDNPNNNQSRLNHNKVINRTSSINTEIEILSDKSSNGLNKIYDDNPLVMAEKLRLSLIELDKRQVLAINKLTKISKNRKDKVVNIIRKLGFLPEKLMQKNPKLSNEAMGGPLIGLMSKAIGDESEDLLSTDQVKFDNIINDLEDANHLSNILFRMPILTPMYIGGKMSSGFGPRRDPINGKYALHLGLDFKGKRGTSLYATAPGIVVRAERAGAYGKLIVIEHENNIETRYAHLDAIIVKVGDKVKGGQKIGALGNTGRSTGPHLHYETRIDGVAVNPKRFLEAGKYVFKKKEG